MLKKTFAVLFIGSLVATGGTAAVSPEQAAQLGRDLTPMGAEKGGNADGSIPPWNAAGTPIRADFVPGPDNYINPYADEKPLYTIDNSNWKQYSDVLTAGTRAMF